MATPIEQTPALSQQEWDRFVENVERMKSAPLSAPDLPDLGAAVQLAHELGLFSK